MENIFENAKFGDKFITRDNRRAIFLGSYELNPEQLDNIENILLYELITEDRVIITVNCNGIVDFENNVEDKDDIIKKYQDTIDEFLMVLNNKN